MTQTVKDTGKNSAKHVGKLQVSTPSDREIAMTRVFDAPRSLVFDAFTMLPSLPLRPTALPPASLM